MTASTTRRLQPTEQAGERGEFLGISVPHRENLRYQQHRTHPGLSSRFGGEQRSDPPAQRVLGCGGIDEDVGVEGVHSGTVACLADRVDEFVGSLGRESGRGQRLLTGGSHQVGDLTGLPDRDLGPAGAQRVRPDKHGNRLPMPGDGDLGTVGDQPCGRSAPVRHQPAHRPS